MVLIRSLIISRVIVNKTKKNRYSLKKNSIQFKQNCYHGAFSQQIIDLNYEKWFVYPLVDYKLKPGFKVFNISLDEV